MKNYSGLLDSDEGDFHHGCKDRPDQKTVRSLRCKTKNCLQEFQRDEDFSLTLFLQTSRLDRRHVRTVEVTRKVRFEMVERTARDNTKASSR